MNKKILSGIVFAMLVFTLSAFADTLPNFPMSLWGTVKNGTTSITSGTVQVYNGLTKVGEIAVGSNGQYGGNTAFDNKITLTEFTGSLSYKLITGGLTYNLTSSNITKINSDNCSENTNITFVSDVCQYDLNLDSNTPTCDPVSVINGLVNSTTCAITCNTGYNLSGTSCVGQSTGDTVPGGVIGGGTSGGSSGFTPTILTCSDSNLVCTNGIYKVKSGVSCTGGNLNKSCIVTSTGNLNTTSTGNLNTTSTGNLDNSIIDFTEEIKSATDKNGITYIKTKDGKIIKLSDISKSFAKSYIEKLVVAGILNGYDDGSFRPNNPISRGEYLGIMMKTFNIPVDETLIKSSSFTDIKEGSWIIKYAEKAREFGISDKTNNFNPNKNITRAESLAMLFRISSVVADSEVRADFNDTDIEEWMNKYIDTAYSMGLVRGSQIDGKAYFKPNSNLTRAEASIIIVKLLENLQK